jgi:HD-GYP domain-containing protein (c-di-GMP phosphodiesterase class II)
MVPNLFDEVADRFIARPKPQTPQPALIDLLIATSKAVDMLEGRHIRHGLKIAALSGTLAKAMGVPPREVISIVFAGLLHDIGLARIIADILPHVPSGMTEKELFYSHALLNSRIVGMHQDKRLSQTAQALLSSHPQAAADFVDAVYLSSDVKEIIATHHELCDGTGYPHGLSLEQIPLGGRILSFADSLEGVMQEVTGLTSRKTAIESFLEIKAGHKFDPEVIKAFRSLINTNPDFLRQLFTLEVEDIVKGLMNERMVALSGKVFLDTIRAMSRLPDRLLPQFTSTHSEKVAYYALRIAQSLGVNRTQVGELLVASLLHDIGKLGVPMSILTKAEGLSDEEMEAFQNHAHYTEEILKGIPGFENVIAWSAEHHEQMNGRGYPAHKKGFEITLGGRIISVANAFDNLTSSRPDRLEPIEPMDALPILGQGRYRLYDSQLVSILRTVVLESEMVIA